ncbi:MAG: 2-C-methyl-D-erythritol 4-phosphate cytidylyltransferase [Elusimicrobiota bacterium]
MPAWAVVVAAGRGRRFGPRSRPPKQFQPLRGKPLLYWPLKTLEGTPAVRGVVLVVPPGAAARCRAFARRQGLRKVKAVVDGGAERADSVRRGVAAVPREADVVLVHDAARALLPRDVVERVVRAARRTGAALAAWPVPDTVKMDDGRGRVRRTVPRGNLWLAQTPQALRRDLAGKYLLRAGASSTDDVQALERAGLPVALVPGSPLNFKVTRPEDFAMCEAILKAGRRR